MTSFDAFLQVREEEQGRWCTSLGLNLRSLRQAVNIRSQLCSLASRHHLPITNNRLVSAVERKQNIKKCLCHGFFMQSALYDRDGFYLTAKEAQRARIHPSSSVASASQWVIYNELVETSASYIRTVSQVEGKWLAGIAPDYFDLTTFPEGRMKQELIYLYRDLLL